MTLLATFKHISSKNADYGAAEAYLTFEHDEFTMKATLDENGRLIPREDYRISSPVSYTHLVITIIYGYKADSQQRKYLFQIISNLQIISSES